MKDKLKGVLIGIAAVAVLATGGAAIAGASGGGDDDATDKPIAGKALDRAGAAALKSTDGGKVTETEVSDEEGYYEVEVTRGNGSQLDVHLDRDFNVLSSVADNDSGEGDKNDKNDKD